jgi:ornithine carbamoyltransferase
MVGRFLSVTDLGEDGLRRVLESAAAVKVNPGSVADRLRGAKVGLFFQKPSTRTRVSCEAACVDLGAHPVVLRQDEVGLGSREAVQDVARVLARYLDAVAMRVFDHGDLEGLAAHSSVPVINLLSDRSHPCQALADLQTVAEHRPLPGTTLTYIGDGNNVAHSLLLAGAMSGMHIRVVTPEGYQPAGDVTDEARSIAASSGGSIAITTDPAAVEGSDVVYTDVWASMGQEDEAAARRSLFAAYQVDERLLDAAGPAALFMHCLPAHRGEEVTDAVMESQRSVVFDQAENRMHSFKALLLHLLE